MCVEERGAGLRHTWDAAQGCPNGRPLVVLVVILVVVAAGAAGRAGWYHPGRWGFFGGSVRIASFYYLADPDTSPADWHNAMSEVYVEVGPEGSDFEHFERTYAVTVCTVGFLKDHIRTHPYFAEPLADRGGYLRRPRDQAGT